MTSKFLTLAAILALIIPASAINLSMPVVNYSFEVNNGFNASSYPTATGDTTYWSVGTPIPGWNTTGYETGQWIVNGYANNPQAFDGSVLAYTNGGSIWQDVGTAMAGNLYTLQVEVLHRTDAPMTGLVQLEIGGVVVATAVGPDAGPGTWNDFTAAYTATAADAGQTLTILLSGNSPQADFDFVRLDRTTPEPMTLLLLGSGLAIPALKKLRRNAR